MGKRIEENVSVVLKGDYDAFWKSGLFNLLAYLSQNKWFTIREYTYVTYILIVTKYFETLLIIIIESICQCGLIFGGWSHSTFIIHNNFSGCIYNLPQCTSILYFRIPGINLDVSARRMKVCLGQMQNLQETLSTCFSVATVTNKSLQRDTCNFNSDISTFITRIINFIKSCFKAWVRCNSADR